MSTDIVKNYSVFDQFKKNAVIARYPKWPKAIKRTVKFMRTKTWMKRFFPKKNILSVNEVLNVSRQLLVWLPEIGSIMNISYSCHGLWTKPSGGRNHNCFFLSIFFSATRYFCQCFVYFLLPFLKQLKIFPRYDNKFFSPAYFFRNCCNSWIHMMRAYHLRRVYVK